MNIGVIVGGSVAGVFFALALVVTIVIVVAIIIKLIPKTESEWYVLLFASAVVATRSDCLTNWAVISIIIAKPNKTIYLNRTATI